ncbi:MAG TPA: hypothetical protein PK228_11630, partial [Saprospiraceae bacterium]|nr:hypothetical protein [Saprospiraceae bacterium]
MKNKLLFALILLLVAHAGWTQCNPKEYTRIFSEAQALQEKGQFIEAKNTYEAAKIFACNQKEKDAADAAVDRLFEEIERLRQRADSLRQAAEKNARATENIAVVMANTAKNP